MSSLAENQKRTAQAFIDGYKEYTSEGLVRVRADDCVHVMLPESMGSPNLTNKEYVQLFEQFAPMMQNVKFIPLKLINVPEELTAIVHARGTAETVVGPYKNEYVFFLTFNEDGTEIVRIEEFVDSAFTQRLLQKFQAFAAEQSKQ